MDGPVSHLLQVTKPTHFFESAQEAPPPWRLPPPLPGQTYPSLSWTSLTCTKIVFHVFVSLVAREWIPKSCYSSFSSLTPRTNIQALIDNSQMSSNEQMINTQVCTLLLSHSPLQGPEKQLLAITEKLVLLQLLHQGNFPEAERKWWACCLAICSFSQGHEATFECTLHRRL